MHTAKIHMGWMARSCLVELALAVLQMGAKYYAHLSVPRHTGHIMASRLLLVGVLTCRTLLLWHFNLHRGYDYVWLYG
jgi:hypothetical protein